MAHLLLIVVVVTMIGVNADPKANNDPFQGFPFQQFPKITFPQIQLPTFPTFPNIPQFTPIFPTIPPIPPINIPSAEDIINQGSNPNGVYSGIVVQSSSGYVKDKDGNLVKTGGTTVVTNNNGDVQKYSVGNNPPPVAKVVPPFKHPKITIEKGMLPKIKLSKLPKIELPEIPEVKIPGIVDIKPMQFAPIDFSKLPDIPSREYTKIKITEVPVIQPLPLYFPPIQPAFTYTELKNVKPGKNQNFVGSSTSSFSVSSNINGKKNFVGGTNVLLNDNGKIDEQTVALQNNNDI